MKTILQTLKKIKHTHIAALLFLAYIVVVAVAAFPPAFLHTVTYWANSRPGIIAARNKVDEEYKAMLGFTGNPLVNKGTYINLNGLMARAVGKREVNARIRLHNGHLAGVIGERDVAPAAAQMIKLYNRTAQDGKAFLFVLAPSQISKYEDLLPTGYVDYSNRNSDDMLNALRAADVPVLDLRDVQRDEGLLNADAFFVTDHHWRPETGAWAYAKIIERLTQDGVIPAVDAMYTDTARFRSEVFPNWFLGSSGKRTGRFFAGADDFSLVTPPFETFLSLEIPSAGIEKQGDFAEISYDQSANVRNFFVAGPYTGYGHGDKDLTMYRNPSAPLDVKLLSIGDSFGNVPFTFMPLVFEACDELDMRAFKADFAAYYETFDPDVVIVLVNNETVVQDNTTYNFFPEP